MNPLKILLLLFGLGLFAFVLANTDWRDAMETARGIGIGFPIILVLFGLAFSLDVAAWQLALTPARLNWKWFSRLFLVRLAGEAFNNVTPAASVGGEPLKLVMLKKYYDVDVRDGVASLVIAKTTFVVALVLFLIFGFFLILRSGPEIAPFRYISSVGLAALIAGVGLFFIVQRFRITSSTLGFLSRRGPFRIVGTILHHIQDFDSRLIAFYARKPARFYSSIFLAFVNWVLGALEIYIVMIFLGHPIGFDDAWMIETLAQLARAASFFIPLSLGVQEGAFLVIVSALTGSAPLGVAVALIRRARELIWIAFGFAVFQLVRRDRGEIRASDR